MEEFDSAEAITFGLIKQWKPVEEDDESLKAAEKRKFLERHDRARLFVSADFLNTMRGATPSPNAPALADTNSAEAKRHESRSSACLETDTSMCAAPPGMIR
jgi:hypothetical protein